MKRIIIGAFFFLSAWGGIFPSPAWADADDAKPGATNAAPSEPVVSRDTNGNVVIHLEEEAQKQAGLKVEELVATQFAPELKAYGHVLDPGPLAAQATELATDQAASSASSNELARLKMLSTSGNASARALQAAEANALHDELLTESARDRLVLSWGKEIASQNNNETFIQSLTSLGTILIRIDLPAGQRLNVPPTSARVVSLSGDSAEAQVLGVALNVDPLTQGRGFILQVKTNDSRFLPGEAVTGYLKVAGEPLSGVMIPRSAIIRAEGQSWIYVAKDDDHFTRKNIVLDRPTDDGCFVTNGVIAGDHVVIVGAQALFSEETKPSGPPAD